MSKKKKHRASNLKVYENDLVGDSIANRINEIFENSRVTVFDEHNNIRIEYDLTPEDVANLSSMYNYWYEEYWLMIEELRTDENIIEWLQKMLREHGIDFE